MPEEMERKRKRDRDRTLTRQRCPRQTAKRRGRGSSSSKHKNGSGIWRTKDRRGEVKERGGGQEGEKYQVCGVELGVQSSFHDLLGDSHCGLDRFEQPKAAEDAAAEDEEEEEGEEGEE
jgi:hypothetical protein